MRVTEFYCEKHYERAERNLKKSYYIDYVLSQMTIGEDLELEKKRHSERKDSDKKKKKVTIKDIKALPQSQQLVQESKRVQKKKKKREEKFRKISDNLFEEDIISGDSEEIIETAKSKPLTKRIKH